MDQGEYDADDTELEDKRVCSACIGDSFLKAEVEAGSAIATCAYCTNEGKAISIGRPWNPATVPSSLGL